MPGISIQGYHHSRPIQFCHEDGTVGITAQQGALYLGAEIETDTIRPVSWNTDALKNKLTTCGFLPFCDPTSDGSLHNGCEFVSYPATLKHWLSIKESMITPAFNALVEAGLRAHQAETCGLHIHMSRAYMNPASDNADMVARTYSNMLVIMENNWNQWSHFARRGESHYAKRVFKGDSGTIKKVSKQRPIYEQLDGSQIEDRYRAVNFAKRGTIEIRIFKGTLNVNTFYATLELVDNFARLVKTIDIADAADVDFMDIVRFKQYPELEQYIREIKLYQNSEATFKDKGEEE